MQTKISKKPITKKLRLMKRLIPCFLIYIIISIFFVPVFAQNGQLNHKIDKIVLDPGHGGNDPGASGKTAKEKNITLSIALMAGELIEQYLTDVTVIYTRKDDRFVELHKRAQVANESGADLFISIHCNSNVSSRPFGSETYVMGLHKTDENLEVAKTENAAILMEANYQQEYEGFNPNFDEDYIMLSMFQSAHIEQSLELALATQEKLKVVSNLYDRGVRQAGFVVLYLTTMPGILVETGFLSNPAEEKFLLNTKNQRKIAQAIYQAIHDFKINYEEGYLTLATPEIPPGTEYQEKIAEPIFRIGFGSFAEPQPIDHRLFKGMTDVYCYYQDDNKYHYAFGKFSALEDAVKYFLYCVEERKIKRKFLKNAVIFEFEEEKIISALKAKRYLEK